MIIPFLDLHRLHQDIREELDEAYQTVMDSGWYVLGDEVEAFEDEFARWCGASHCVGVGNGLEALTLILRGYGIGPGDEVIVPAHTFIATWFAVSAVGATPVGVDVEPETLNLDPDHIEPAITPRTRAVIAVHLYGQTADMTRITALARDRGLLVIEDAAQAHGATHRGRAAGTLGNAAAFSFYPGKNLGALGDGGAVVTGDRALADRVRLVRNYGSRQKYVHELPGTNSRLDELQAAFLRIKLRHIDHWNDERRRVAEGYRAGLADLLQLTLPVVHPENDSVWHLFVIRNSAREALMTRLQEHGIQTQIHYPTPPHLSLAYKGEDRAKVSFPTSEAAATEALSLPMASYLTNEEVEAVCAAIRISL